MYRPSDCELLRPSLVAFVHGEPHPETPKLLAHLQVCRSCSREEEELRGTLELIEMAMLPVQSRVGRRTVRAWGFWQESVGPHAWHILTGVAALFLLSVLFLGGREGSRSPVPRVIPPSAASHPALASGSFSGDEIDEKLDAAEKRIRALKPSGRSPW